MKTKIIRYQIKEKIGYLSDREREDLGLLKMMIETKRTELVTREMVMKKLSHTN